jgi:hypothetical protein
VDSQGEEESEADTVSNKLVLVELLMVIFSNCIYQEDRLEKMSGDELHQRIEALKIRRRNDRINKILYSASKGDLTGMKEALKVSLDFKL